MKMKKMTAAQIAAALPTLPGWKVKGGKLHREYKFPDFKHAMKVHALCGCGHQQDGPSSGVVQRL